MSNLGHEIALSEIRISSRSFALRVMSALGGSVGFLMFCIFAFGSKGILKHVIDFFMSVITYHVRQLPIFGVRKIDALNVLRTHEILMRDATFWKISVSLSGLVFVILFFWLSYSFYKRGQRSHLERIMRGNHLISPREHNKIMKHEYSEWTKGIKFKRFKKQPTGNKSPLILGKEQAIVPEALQYLHFAFIGASGCGKSNAIEEIISQVKNRQEKAFIVDLNGAFYSKFGREEDHILSLRDPRARKWDFWSEQVEPENLAAAMIEAETGSHQYFWKGARAVLASLLKNNSSCHELWEDFKKSTADIRIKLADKNEISQRIIGSKDGDQADGILGTTVLDFAFLKELNQWTQEKKKFSILDWVKNDKDRGWVYLIVSDKDLEISKPLLRVWFDLACIGALNRDSANPHNSHLWLMIDELKSIGQLPSLPAILDKGRKYKTSVVLGLQAISQIEKIYGHHDSRSILQGVQNQFYFKMNEVESAKYASDVLGEQELEQANLGITFGQKDNHDRGSLSRSTMQKRVVLPDEIKSLRPLECYAKFSHHQPFKLHFDLSKRPIVHASVESRINKNYQIGQPCAPDDAPKSKEENVSRPWLLGVPPNHNEVSP